MNIKVIFHTPVFDPLQNRSMRKKQNNLLWVPICNKLVWIYFNYIFYVVQKLPENEKQNQFSNVSLNLTVTKYFLFSPSRLNALISPVRLCLISILLIKRQKREKERKKPNRAAFRCLLCPQCVSVIYCSGSDSECVTHPKNQPPHPPAEIIHSYSRHIHTHTPTIITECYPKVTLYNPGTVRSDSVLMFPTSEAEMKISTSWNNHLCMLCCSTSTRLYLAALSSSALLN